MSTSSAMSQQSDMGFKGCPLHDMAIKIIAEFLHGDNNTLLNMLRVNKRFYSLRRFFFNHIVLNSETSAIAYHKRPPYWKHVDTIKLDGDIIKCPKILNLSIFSNIRCVTLYNIQCRMRPLSALRHVHELVLICCHNICDVSSLGSVHTLEIHCCDKIRDVSALKNVHTLTITNSDVRDVSSLGSVNTLTLNTCNSITDISNLGTVHNLTIEYCTGISNLWFTNQISTMHTLNLCGYDIIDFSNSQLPSINTLTLTCCDIIINVSAFKHIHLLTIESGDEIRDVADWNNVHTVKLTSSRISDISRLKGVKEICLHNCSYITDVSAIVNVSKLTITNCNGILDFSILRNVPHLELDQHVIERMKTKTSKISVIWGSLCIFHSIVRYFIPDNEIWYRLGLIVVIPFGLYLICMSMRNA